MKVHEMNMEHPVISELKKKMKECRYTLLELLNEWHYLKEKATQSIMFTYESLFGDLEYEIQRKGKTASALERRVELLALKLKKGEKLNTKIIDYINLVVKNEILRRQSIFEKNEANSNITKTNEKIESVIEQQLEAPQLYRQLVKRMHPDVNGNNHLFRKFWNNVQDAYKTGDVERLRFFYESICKTRLNKFRDLKSEEISLRTEIKQLELNIQKQRDKIKNLQQEEPFNLKDKLNDKYWIERRKKSLQDKLSYFDRKIIYNKKLLKNLTQDKVVFGSNFNLIPRNSLMEQNA